jgi:hypothetical protein
MTQTQWLIILICGVVLWSIVIAIRDWLKSRRERPIYQAVADSLNFTLSEDAAIESLPRKDRFLLFTGKASQHIPIMLRGTIGNIEVKILEYHYTMPSSTQKSSRRSKPQTLVMLQSPEFDWPDLMMMPDSFALKLTKVLGMKDIDFENAPEFSKRYYLIGSDEASIRRVFRQEVTDAFAYQKGWCVEAHGDSIVFRLKDKRVPPSDIQTFLEETLEFLQLMTRTG